MTTEFSEGQRVSVYLSTRGKGYGALGGWVKYCVHGTIHEVYPYKRKALVKLDEYFYKYFHMIKFEDMEKHP